MHDIDLIALLLTIIVILVAIWFFRKVLILVAILIVIAVLAYIFLQNNPNAGSGQFNKFKPQAQNTNLLESFRDNYCSILYDRDDSLLCLDIVEPIYNDIVKNYNLDSVESLNKRQFINLIIEVAKRNKGQILRNLERDNALYLWKDFVADIKDFNIF